MGIIEKQATRNAIYSYIGAALGAISLFWMPQPNMLSTDENGLRALLISISALLAQFGNLGFSAVTIRFFPYFRNKEKGHHGFLYYSLLVSFIGFLLCFAVFLVLKNWIVETNIHKSKLFVDYLFYLMPLTFFTLFFNVFDTYLRATYSSVIGSFTKDFFQRISILILLAVYFFKVIDFPVFIFAYVVLTCLPTLILLLYIIKQGEWHVKPVKGFINRELRTEIVKLSIYSIISGGAGAVIMNIDVFMVNHLLDLKQTGIYAIAFYFGTIIIIPARSIYRISSSIVAEAFKQGNIEEIKRLYNKTCNTQMAIGLLLFIGIWCNVDNVMNILPEAYSSGRDVILIISIGYLFEMITGINQVIIANSRYYKYDTYFLIIIVFIVIGCNEWLIPIYGIAGSAMATAITAICYNVARWLFLFFVYKMQPYDLNTLKIILVAILAFIPGYFLPYMHNLVIDIAVRSSIIGGIFVLLLLKLEAAPELNSKIRMILSGLFKK
ncbi:MAG: rane protein involved in the export of O-antigen and teichoic acid [Bacteroidetes bacterium]|nr:rane protein involved in the export of O-antigen and teichoic acid [Bacteroidota bacterium]